MKCTELIGPISAIQSEYGCYLTDESRLPGGYADSLAFPRSENEIACLLEQAHSNASPVTISSGRTGIVGGAVPFGGLLVSLERMNRFLGIRWNGEKNAWTARVQPGMSIESLDAVLKGRHIPDGVDYKDSVEEKDTARFFAESGKWFYPPDPTEGTAQIGGTAATNASGARSYRYGPTRCFIKGLRVVLADGSVLCLERGRNFHLDHLRNPIVVPVPEYRRPSVKNAAGYFSGDTVDLIDLFIGSEGTLGVISELTLLLAPRPSDFFAGVSFFPDEPSALGFVQALRSHPACRPSVLEYFDMRSLVLLEQNFEEAMPVSRSPEGTAVYFEQEVPESGPDKLMRDYENIMIKNHTGMDKTWGAVEEREWKKMVRFRHTLPETVNRLIARRQKDIPSLHKIGTDFAVSDSCLERMFSLYHEKLENSGLEYVIFGHVGENHVHVNILPRNDVELELARKLYMEMAKNIVEMGGAVSGEHGIGKIKKALLQIQYSPDALRDMKNVKSALDSRWILGQGTLFPVDS
jgi:D-lactate dehydrogenase (cytochrome)